MYKLDLSVNKFKLFFTTFNILLYVCLKPYFYKIGTEGKKYLYTLWLIHLAVNQPYQPKLLSPLTRSE